MLMNILVFGAKGWIGGQFVSILEENNIPYVNGNSRVDDIAQIERELEEEKPTHVISFIGRTHGSIGSKIYSTIDYLEQDGKLQENIRDNLFAPITLAHACKERNIHFTYLGTGCIFKFDDEHPFGKEENGFTEDSLPNFFGSSYSVVKGFTDRMMKQFFDKDMLNLRIRMPISGEKNPRNFITKITTYEKICSIPNSMTVLPELLPIVLDMMLKEHVGTINLTNPGLISHNEILDLYKEIVDPTFTYQNFTQEKQRAILDADRSNNYLDTTTLETLYPNVQPIRDSIKMMLYQYKSNMKRILITGGCGFIGSNFINSYFPKASFQVMVNLDAMYYCAKETNVHDSIRDSNQYVHIKDDLSNFKYIQEILEKYNITHILHFAAQSHVQNSFSDSLQYTKDNVMGTHNLLEATRLYGKIERFIHVSTDEVYGESMNTIEEQHKTEQSILCPTNPYAATKAAAELIAQSYNHSFHLPIIISRGNNVYGPNQYPEKLIPKFIKQLKEGDKVTIQGDGSTIRGFLHVDDTVSAFEKILENGVVGEIYNIGCDEHMEYSVMDVAKRLIRLIHHTDDYKKWITYIPDRPYNDKRYYISNQKLKQLGWTINIPFQEGLEKMI
jgi:3,5-epimerase/4-reductase